MLLPRFNTEMAIPDPRIRGTDLFLQIYSARDQYGNRIHSFEEMLANTSNSNIRKLILKLKSLSDQKKEQAKAEMARREFQTPAASVAQQILYRSSSARSGRAVSERAKKFKPQPSKLQGWRAKFGDIPDADMTEDSILFSGPEKY